MASKVYALARQIKALHDLSSLLRITQDSREDRLE